MRAGAFAELAPQALGPAAWLVFDPAFADGGPGFAKTSPERQR